MTVNNSAEPVDPAIHARVTHFLGHEARLLDENRLEEWLELLDQDVLYEIPLRLIKERGARDEYPADFYRVRDDLPMLRKRVQRTTTGEDWSEDPPSRTVRLVGSVAVDAADQPGLYRVASAVIVYRQRGQDRHWDLIPARRHDLIRVTAADCALIRRTVLLAEVILQTPNLGIFL